MRALHFLLCTLLLGSLAAARPAPQEAAPHRRTTAWAPEIVKAFEQLPVQDGGRVKPLSTYAGFKLLKMHHSRTVRLTPEVSGTGEKEKLSPTQWVLDCFFYPDQARNYPVFTIDYDRVLTAIGLDSKKKRDRYSYAELEPGRQRLMEEAQRIRMIDPKDRAPLEGQIYRLATDVLDFEALVHQFEGASHEFSTNGSDDLVAIFGPEKVVGLAGILQKGSELQSLFERAIAAGGEYDTRPLETMLSEVQVYGQIQDLALFPPAGAADAQPEWTGATGLVAPAMRGQRTVDTQVEMLAALEDLARSPDAATRIDTVVELQGKAAALANARGEFAKIPLEVRYYRWDFFTNALVCFLLGFLLLGLTWMMPGQRWLNVPLWLSVAAGAALVVGGIVVRCILRSRPPVSTLYETILFVTACAVLVAMVLEWIHRQRVALALAPILGALGMFLASRYEFKDAQTQGDTMTSLVAVLDTNFWLATHVTTVTLGYSAGLLAAALGNVWLLGRAFGIGKGSPKYKSLVKMTYGVMCFGLLFSIVGTILGGIWANYSWGRFWGWDPKENGALLICLAELFILHARLGGYIRDYGMAAMAALNGGVVVFSWWGVNVLGVGLHSYGFTEGVIPAMLTYAGIQGAILVASAVWWLVDRGKRQALAAVAAH